MTDVFIFRGGTFQNLCAAGAGQSSVRNPFAYACDINADGLVELPELVSLPAADAAEAFREALKKLPLRVNAHRTRRSRRVGLCVIP